MQLPLPLIKNVVLVGGGHAHALVLRSWAMKPVAGVRLTVVNPGPTAPYTGMLPGFIAGHYTRDDLDIDLVKLARFAGARLVLAEVTNIDRSAKTVAVAGRPDLPYDIVSINVGITSDMPALAGFAEHGVAAKPLEAFAQRWTEVVDGVAEGAPAPSVAVIGGGVGGCELAMAMSHRLRVVGARAAVSVIDRGDILSELGERARLDTRTTMEEAGITILEHATVDQVGSQGLSITTASGARDEVPASFVVGAAGARPHAWLAELGLAHESGYLTIDDRLRSISDSSVFVSGDCAHMAFAPRPKAGVFAVRQGPVLRHNIQAALSGSKLKAFDPQADYLKLVSLGSKSAAADKFRRHLKGRALWRLKDGIDRRFMDKLGDLPPMAAEPLPSRVATGLRETLEADPPLCGGCGAKVGADVLAGPLAALPHSCRTDIIRLPGDDAALLEVGGVQQVFTTDQLRPFTDDPYRMAKIAALHAMGDIWAMGAAPQAVLVTVTLPPLSEALQREWLAEIMAGASEAIGETGAEIVGGHTSMGAELALGFSMTGLLEQPAITLAGAQPGDRLVLTRPLGSGLLLAGEMQLKARGGHIATLLAELERPQGSVAAMLTEAGANAMTDVTGFGLAGHLLGMVRASSVSAELWLDEIPFFPGALELAENGLRAHLHASNRSAIPALALSADPRAVGVFDPQTAGGFLAAVPAAAADVVVERMVAEGREAATVGELNAGPVAITTR